MIVYSDSFIDGWNRKIIYAPNGFGKTTSAKQIALNLQKKNIRVGLFTRREIEELVQDFDDKLYMGIDAKTLVEKMRIEEAYSKADPLKKYAKQHCSASTVSAAKKTSFYFNYCGIKNFSDIPSLPAKPNKGLAFPFAKEDGELFSTLIDYSIFKQCEEIVEKKAFLKNKKVLKQNQKDANSQIPSQYLECLYHLYFYVKLNHLSRCVLCGKAYRGNASLVAHIEEQIKLLKPIDSPDCLDQVRRCAEQIF